MDSIAEEAFKNNCSLFYDKKNSRYHTVDEIKSKTRCRLSNNKKNMLYVKRDDKDEYDFVSQTKLATHGCVSNYNRYHNPDNSRPLDLKNDLLSRCSSDTFSDINSDYDNLIKYSYELADELHVDPLIKQFIINLIIYTNITREGLRELYNGAFVIIRDKGFLYNRFKCPGKARICDLTKLIPESSHDSLHKDKQYRIGKGVLYNCGQDGKCNKNEFNTVFDLLVGTSPLEYFYGDTWIQFEYSNLLTSWNKWGLHAYSLFHHIATEQNIGPLGNSYYAEYEKPLILEICKPDICRETTCQPVPCVRPNINLHEYSDNFIRTNNISIGDYKDIKDFIKSKFSLTNKITLKVVKEKIQKYINHCDIRDDFCGLCEKIILYLNILAETNHNNYHREEIIEIMFLINYYIEQVRNSNDETTINEIERKINERYHSRGGGKRGFTVKKAIHNKRHRKTKRRY